MKFLSLFVSSPRPLEERLIEAESKLGGMIFSPDGNSANGRRFWYFQGDWFFEQYYENIGYQVTRYQVLENNIHKLFNGREVPFAEGEKQILIQAIKKYHAAVTEQIYGVSNNSALAV